ncbi:MAG: hypothetical protein J0L64_16025 [Acidobacteria bacterium]|nr:hypothetical protein [Acidobacteriota bacterium]
MSEVLFSRSGALAAGIALLGVCGWSFYVAGPAFAQIVTPVGTYSFVIETQLSSGGAVVDVPAIGQMALAGGQLTGTMQERSNNGLVARELKGVFSLDANGLGRMVLRYEVPAESEDGVSTTETLSRSYVFVASDGATVMEGLRSDAGPI